MAFCSAVTQDREGTKFQLSSSALRLGAVKGRILVAVGIDAPVGNNLVGGVGGTTSNREEHQKRQFVVTLIKFSYKTSVPEE